MSTRRNTPLRGLAAALVVSCITAAAPAAAQTAQVRYAAQTEYTYSADLTFTQRQSVASTSSTSPASATSTQALRLQGTFQISPVSVDVVSGTTVLRLTIPGQFQVFQGDGSGTWTPLSADAGGLQGDYLLEQAANGQVLSVGFQPLAGTTDARTLMARNTIKGLAGLLDFRLAASGSPLAALCTDVMGQYNATFTRTSPTQIQVVKSSYASLAPGLGLYRLDGGTPTPVVEGTLAASGQSLITLDASNTLVARSIDHETVQLVPTEGAYPDPANSLTQVQDGGSFTASNSLWATMSGDVTLVSKVSATSTTWVASAFSDKQSLQGVVLPAQAMPSTPATLARAEARVKEGLLKIQDPATQFQGEMLVARGLRQGASLQAVRDQILDPRADLRVARGLAQALGGCRHAEVRELVRQGLVHPRLHEGVKGALLQALMGAPTVEPELVDAVEKAAGGTGWSAKVASHTLATLVPAIGKDDPARAKRVVADLAAQLEGAKGDGERADLLTRLSATRSIHAAQSLQAYAQDAASPLGRIATRGLQDIAGHVAPVGAPVVATQDAAQQSIYLPVLTPDHFCDLFSTYSIADFTSPKKATIGPLSRSPGSDLIGGMVWVGGGVGVNYPAKKGALGVAGGFRLNLLGMKIPFMDGEGVALYDSATPANGGIFWDYHILGIPGAFQVLPWQDTPDDPNNPYYTHDYPVQFFDMDSGPIPVGPFFADFQAGVGLESGVDFKSELSQPQDMYAVLAPWSGISAYAEASIGWFCVDLALELKGQFLKTSIPIRADMDMRSLMHEDGAPGFSWCLTEDLQVVPWSLQLIGRFDYCIGSASKVLWSDSGRPEVWNLSNNCDPKADLVVKDLIWSPNDDPDASKPMVFTATLANLTNARTNPARPLVAAIQVDGTTVGTFTVKDAAGQPRPLAGGEVYAGQILWNPTAGTHTVTAVVNAVASSSQVSESDYSNDALSKTLTVKPVLPDLVVSGVQVTPGAGGATLAVNLANMGPGPDPVNWVTRPGPRNPSPACMGCSRTWPVRTLRALTRTSVAAPRAEGVCTL